MKEKRPTSEQMEELVFEHIMLCKGGVYGKVCPLVVAIKSIRRQLPGNIRHLEVSTMLLSKGMIVHVVKQV